MRGSVARTLRGRAGFSITEVLVAFTILAVLGAMLTRFIMAQSRYTEQQNAMRDARMVTRQAINLLETELRMVQDSGAVLTASADGRTLSVLVPYRFGVNCGVRSERLVVSMLPIDSLSLAQAVFAGFAWRSRDGVYHTVHSATPPTAAQDATKCTGSNSGEAGIRTLTLNGRAGSVLDVEPALENATVGQPVYFFQRLTYEFRPSQAYPGTYGLYRTAQGRASEELMAPFDSTARFKYWTAGAMASVAAPPALPLIRGVDVVLSALSNSRPVSRGAPSRSQVVATILFRNVRKN